MADMTPWTTGALPLAQEKLDEFTVTPGLLGFVVFAALGLAVWMLLKSMNRQLKRIDFAEGGAAEGGGKAGAGAAVKRPGR